MKPTLSLRRFELACSPDDLRAFGPEIASSLGCRKRRSRWGLRRRRPELPPEHFAKVQRQRPRPDHRLGNKQRHKSNKRPFLRTCLEQIGPPAGCEPAIFQAVQATSAGSCSIRSTRLRTSTPIASSTFAARSSQPLANCGAGWPTPNGPRPRTASTIGTLRSASLASPSS